MKKRFLRQNREIIRANSDQSLKIRSLETEHARLLSENITLREDKIRLNHELSKNRHALALENVGAISHKLQSFAQGLQGLMHELAQAQSTLPEPEPYRQTKRRSPKASPSQRQWRNNFSLADVAGQMPSIVEGKYFPRRTLDAEELATVLNPGTITDSPELSPPPVAHFDIGDPVKQDSPLRKSPQAPQSEPDEPGGLEARSLFANLETRKKRRESTFTRIEEPEKGSEQGKTTQRQKQATAAEASRVIKLGAKRKLSMRDEDEATRPAYSPEGFLYTKKPSEDSQAVVTLPIREASSSTTTSSRRSSQAPSVEKPKTLNKAKPATASAAPPRRALGEKSVNTDPVVSPAKAHAIVAGQLKEIKDIQAGKPEVTKLRPPSPPRSKPISAHPRSAAETRKDSTANTSFELPLRPAPSVDEPVKPATLPPKTPAPTDDLFSPSMSSAPSTAATASRDTPPPSDLIGARPSRRARPSVSYAEPNLRDKMRRPGKELADAVSAEDKARRVARKIAELEAVAQVKEEAAASIGFGSPSWKDLPREQGSPLITKHQDRLAGDVESKAGSAANETIAALMASSNRRLGKAAEMRQSRGLVKGASPLALTALEDVYDVPDSSSLDVQDQNESVTVKGHVRSSRRYSSVPEELGKVVVGNVEQEIGDRGSLRIRSRRRETLANNASSKGDTTTEEMDEAAEARRMAQEQAVEKAGRVATRRRSMMI